MAQAKRYIICFKCGEPFMLEGKEYVSLTVIGQSFILHQIRKMVGMMLCVCRGVLDIPALKRSLDGSRTVATPLAPEVGLFLRECIFDAYNRRYCDTHTAVTLDPFDEEAYAFAKEWLYTHVHEEELSHRVAENFCRSLNSRNFNFAPILTEEGTGGKQWVRSVNS